MPPQLLHRSFIFQPYKLQSPPYLLLINPIPLIIPPLSTPPPPPPTTIIKMGDLPEDPPFTLVTRRRRRRTPPNFHNDAQFPPPVPSFANRDYGTKTPAIARNSGMSNPILKN